MNLEHNMRTVMVFGTFDILHAGHLSLFRQAKRLGDRLIAVVARDSTATLVKGTPPLHTERERKAFLEQMRDIDQVVLGDAKHMYRVIHRLMPDIIALGYDQSAFVDELSKAVRQLSKSVRIVRLKSYRPHRHKTAKIRSYLQKHL